MHANLSFDGFQLHYVRMFLSLYYITDHIVNFHGYHKVLYRGLPLFFSSEQMLPHIFVLWMRSCLFFFYFLDICQ